MRFPSKCSEANYSDGSGSGIDSVASTDFPAASHSHLVPRCCTFPASIVSAVRSAGGVVNGCFSVRGI